MKNALYKEETGVILLDNATTNYLHQEAQI
jgi:hypothetical protein